MSLKYCNFSIIYALNKLSIIAAYIKYDLVQLLNFNILFQDLEPAQPNANPIESFLLFQSLF
jgi:hypothetical protein